jgi:predicted O-methyltransferase YrrM
LIEANYQLMLARIVRLRQGQGVLVADDVSHAPQAGGIIASSGRRIVLGQNGILGLSSRRRIETIPRELDEDGVICLDQTV